MITNLIIAGTGGQGSVLASRIIADAVITENEKNARQGGRKPLSIRVGETFGAAMRGGAVASYVRIGDVLSPFLGEDEGDLVLALEPLEGLRVASKFLAPDGVVAMNTRPVFPVDVNIGFAEYPAIEKIEEMLNRLGKKVVSFDATEIAVAVGTVKALNVVMIGAAYASGKLPVSKESLMIALEKRLPKKVLDLNLKAFELGYQAARALV